MSLRRFHRPNGLTTPAIIETSITQNGGSITLCGFSGGSGAAAGRFFKSRTWSGTITWQIYDGSDACNTGFLATDTLSQGGSAAWSAGDNTCSVSSNSLTINGTAADSSGPFPAYLEGDNSGYTFSYGATFTITGNGSCMTIGVGNKGSASGTLTEVLSNEDTFTDAQARADADYSAYDSAYNNTPALTGTAVGSGMPYENVKYRVTQNGCSAGGHYQSTVQLWRCTLNPSSPFDTTGATYYADDVHTGYADGLGVLVITALAVPNTLGYATFAKASTAVVISIP